MTHPTIGLAMVAALGIASPALADCRPSFVEVRETNGDTSIDPFDPDPYGRALQITIENSGSTDCRLSLGALGETLGRRYLTGTRIAFDLRINSQIIPNNVEPAFGPEIRVAAGSRSVQFLELIAARPVYAPPTASEAFFRLKLYDRDGGGLEIADFATRMFANVIARAQVNVAGAAGSFGAGFAVKTIDFGTLERDEQRTVHLQLRTNTTATVRVRTEHGGRMTNITDPRYFVRYGMTVGGRPIALVDSATPDEIPIAPSGTIAGESLPLVLKVGDTREAIAGTYSDTITIDITAD